MTSNFLVDEDLPRWWPKAIIAQGFTGTIWRVGDPGAPPLQSPDPLLLEWCELHDFFLLTNNRSSMPGHLADHVARGRHIPGIFVVRPNLSIVEVAAELELIAGASFREDYQDTIYPLPVSR